MNQTMKLFSYRPFALRWATLFGLFAIASGLLLLFGSEGAPGAQPGVAAQSSPAADRMQWFRNDKFGMFIHWGPYALLAGEYTVSVRPAAESDRNLMYFQSLVLEPAGLAGQANVVGKAGKRHRSA